MNDKWFDGWNTNGQASNDAANRRFDCPAFPPSPQNRADKTPRQEHPCGFALNARAEATLHFACRPAPLGSLRFAPASGQAFSAEEESW